MGGEQELQGPDLTRGVAPEQVGDGGVLLGHAEGKPVLLVSRGTEWFAIAANCTHYSGPLAEGLITEDTVRCPWHHACFDLRTGRSLRPPALHDLDRWAVEQRGRKIYVADKLQPTKEPARKGSRKGHPESVVIVGGGAAGDNAAATLRREGYQGPITVIDPDESAPYDRPNCSKDYLAGNAPEDWLPLRPPDWERDQEITRLSGRRVASLDPRQRRIILDDGASHQYGALLLATGASPVRLPPEATRAGLPVYYLRTLADSRAIIAAAEKAKRVVILGASFIGLEVAASLRARELEVHVVAPGKRPLERVMGPALGDFIRSLHEEHGVVFHLGQEAKQIGAKEVVLKQGARLAADFVVAGIGVRPNLELAEAAGLTLERGLVVSELLETSAPGIFAAGDIARWPDPHTGDRIRVEHWVVAQRQGQAAARNMLGLGQRFDQVPFFWSQHYDVPINYVGHAERWDAIEVDGDIAGRDCAVRFMKGKEALAVATIYRDRDSLDAEVSMEAAASR